MPTQRFDVEDEPPARRIAIGLAKIGLALKGRSWRQAGPRGISPTQGQILAILHTEPTGALTLTEIAERLAVAPPTASDAVRALVAKGLVSKRRDQRDGRAVAISLTDRGRAEAERVAGWPDFLAAAAATLSPGEQAVFVRALVKLVRELQERGDIPVARMCVSCRYFRPNVHPDAERPHHCAYVDAAFGDRSLRLDCHDHEPATRASQERTWLAFLGGTP